MSDRTEGVGVVVLAYDAPDGVLEASVRSVRSAGPDVPVLVVDNGHDADRRLRSAELVGGVDASVEVVRSPRNGGFGAGMNLGIRRLLDGGVDVVVLLNDDVEVTDGWLEPLLAAFDDPHVGAVQPTLAWHGSDPLRVNSTGVAVDATGQGHDLERDRTVDELGPDGPPRDVPAFTGGAVALHRRMLADVGLFDERFFLYYEDVDLARRAAGSGWRFRHVPAALVLHHGSATATGLGDRARRLQERNRLWCSALHGSARELAGAWWLSIRRLRVPPRAVHASALLAGAAGTPIRLFERLRGRPHRSTRIDA